jgi:hypothetical protein
MWTHGSVGRVSEYPLRARLYEYRVAFVHERLDGRRGERSASLPDSCRVLASDP